MPPQAPSPVGGSGGSWESPELGVRSPGASPGSAADLLCDLPNCLPLSGPETLHAR